MWLESGIVLVTGSVNALAIDLPQQTALALGGDAEVGPVAVTGSTAGFLILQEGGSLNGKNGNPGEGASVMPPEPIVIALPEIT